MAESERTQARQRRAGGREQRRSLTAKPFEEMQQTADSGDESRKSQAFAAAKKAAGTAAAAALAGALAGGAKALIDRRHRDREQSASPRDEERNPPRDEPRDESSDAPSDEPDEEPSDEPNEKPEDVEEVSDSADDNDDEEHDDNSSRERNQPQRGASSSDVSKMMERACSHLQDLLGEQPENVSGIESSNGSWTVALEVVEVHRVPETTDVLASYDVVMDDDGDLVRLERTRRYFRSQVEEGS
jgi:hypothetical protein